MPTWRIKTFEQEKERLKINTKEKLLRAQQRRAAAMVDITSTSDPAFRRLLQTLTMEGDDPLIGPALIDRRGDLRHVSRSMNITAADWEKLIDINYTWNEFANEFMSRWQLVSINGEDFVVAKSWIRDIDLRDYSLAFQLDDQFIFILNSSITDVAMVSPWLHGLLRFFASTKCQSDSSLSVAMPSLLQHALDRPSGIHLKVNELAVHHRCKSMTSVAWKSMMRIAESKLTCHVSMLEHAESAFSEELGSSTTTVSHLVLLGEVRHDNPCAEVLRRILSSSTTIQRIEFNTTPWWIDFLSSSTRRFDSISINRQSDVDEIYALIQRDNARSVHFRPMNGNQHEQMALIDPQTIEDALQHNRTLEDLVIKGVPHDHLLTMTSKLVLYKNMVRRENDDAVNLVTRQAPGKAASLLPHFLSSRCISKSPNHLFDYLQRKNQSILNILNACQSIRLRRFRERTVAKVLSISKDIERLEIMNNSFVDDREAEASATTTEVGKALRQLQARLLASSEAGDVGWNASMN
eukprot:CAMPEP_0119568022 /NCGR_PEP_ID=MMETSP1352-20130426/37673_1 /TAXON_ID=265584 /ORGANISM="Stauroneis constricta, Strain CCMP1120" /LENGTH=521 /DNA_ID=CAMNT_0007617355 /DNA_START=44 /DNA_END=1609 /DNA_ORIENTATION=-